MPSAPSPMTLTTGRSGAALRLRLLLALVALTVLGLAAARYHNLSLYLAELALNLLGHRHHNFFCETQPAHLHGGRDHREGFAKSDSVRQEGTSLVIGAMTRHAEGGESAEVRAAIPALADLAAQIGDRQVPAYIPHLGGDYEHGDVLRVVLARAARSARATTHFDLDFPRVPQRDPYWCHKHRRECRPIDRAEHFLRRYTLDTLAREELGLNPEDLGSPWGAALFSFSAFAAGASIPLLPFLVASGPQSLVIAITLTALALFGVGATLSLFTGRNAWWSGTRMLGIGVAAGAVTYLIGKGLGVTLT